MLPQDTYQGQLNRSRRPIQRRAIAALALLIGLAFLASPAMADWTVHYTVNPADGSGGLISGAGSTDATAITETNINSAENSQITAAAKAGYVFSHWDQIRTDTEPDQDIGDWGSSAYYQGAMTPDSVWTITANFTPIATSYTVSMTSAATSVTEGVNGSNTFTVHVSPAVQPGQWVKVKIRTYPSTAQPGGDDFTAPDGIPHTTSDVGVEYTLNPGEDHLDITVAITDDNVVEGSQAFYLVCFNPTTSTGSSVSPNLTYRYLTIIDNDTATMNLAKKTDGVEGGANAAFTVSTTANLETPVTVNLSTVTGTAASPGDYTAISGQSVTLGAAATYSNRVSGDSSDVSVTVQNDGAVEAPETFGAQITVGTKSAVGTGSATATITDNDTATVNLAKKTDGVEGGANAAFTVSTTANLETPVTVNLSTVAGTAESPGDYTAISGQSVTLGSAATSSSMVSGDSQDVTVTVQNDTLIEGDETFGAQISAGTKSVVGTGSATATITDSDKTTVSITATDDSASETAGNTGRFTVSLGVGKVAPPGGIAVSFNVTGTAAPGIDYTALSSSVTIAAGANAATIDVSGIVDDNVIETGGETVVVTLTGTNNPGATVDLGAPSATVTIADNDTATVSIEATDADAGETAGNTGRFTVTLSDAKVAPAAGIVVNYSTGGTATTVTDYAALGGSVSIPSGSGTANISVVAVNDSIVEADETVIATLTGTNNTSVSVVGAPGPGAGTASDRVTIADNDTATFTIEDVSGGEDDGDMSFTVTLSRAVQGGVQVDYATADGTATVDDGDYGAATGTLSFVGLAGETETITVTPAADGKVEADETFTVSLSNVTPLVFGVPAGSIDASDTATGTILNDEAATVTMAPVTVDQDEGAGGAATEFTFSVTLNTDVQGGFSLAYTTDDGSATTADGDYVDNDGTLTFAGTAGEEHLITVTVNDDSKLEADETFTVAAGDFSDLAPGVDAGQLSVAGTPQTATIRNDDASELSITNSLIIAEGSTGGGTTDFVFTVTLNRAVQDGFSLAYTTDDGSDPDALLNATLGDNDYVDNDGTLVFDGTAGETHTITVQVNQDSQVEGNEQFTVTLGTATPVNAGIGAIGTGASGTGTITNDDIYMITIDDVGSAAAPTVNEGGGVPAAFTVRLHQADAGKTAQAVLAGQSVTVAYHTWDVTALNGLDYTETSGTLTFNAGESSATVSVPILDRTFDNDPGVHDDPAIFYVGLTTPSANAQIDDSVGYAYIEDDDYTIYPSAGSGGVMTPNVPETVESGADSSVYTIQGTGCIKDIKDNGTSVFTATTDPSPCDHSDPSSACNQTTYQVLNVTEDHTVVATFREVFAFKGLLEPVDVRSPYGRWRLIDESATVAAGHEIFVGGDAEGWNEHGDEVTLNCAHTTYTLQFRDVPGYFKPAEQAFEVPMTNTEHPVVRTGTYTSKIYTLTIHIVGGTGGESVSLDPPAPEEGGENVYVFEAGTDPVVNLTASGAPEPDPSLFRRWEGAVTSLYNITTAVTMDGNKTVTVYFEVPGVDADGDGYVAGTDPGQDCDDTNPDIHPDAVEICGNAVDENCDGSADACGANDLDNDGDGYTENMGDCDDDNAAIHPGADEICGNAVDEDCYDGPRDCGVEVTCVDYSEAPLETQAQAAPPNIMFLLDDSGSMTWSFMTFQGDGIFDGYYNVFDVDSSRALPSTYRRRWKSQWSGYNRMYYNPATVYVPWPRWNTFATGSPPVDADPDNPRSNPMNATPTLDLNDTFMAIVIPPPTNQRITVRRQNPDSLSMGSNTCADAVGLHPSASGALGSGTPAIVVDNQDSGAAGEQGTYEEVGSWSESNSSGEWDGSSHYTNKSNASATWTPDVPASGTYRVYAWVSEYSRRDPNADYTIYHDDGGDGEIEYTALMNQGLYGGQWYQLNRTAESDSLFYFSNQSIATSTIDVRNAHYFVWKDLDTSGTVDPGEVFLINLAGSGGTGTIEYYRFTDADASDTNPAAYSYDDVDDGELTALTEDQARTLGIIPVDAEGSERTYAQERQNFANWFTFYRRREHTAKAAIGRVIDSVDGMNVGIHSINGHIKEAVVPIGVTGVVVKIIDNGDSGYAESGTWSDSTSPSPYEGDARYTSTSGDYATFTPTFAAGEGGVYRVWAWWNCYADRDANAQFTITHAGGTDTVYKDQRQGGADGCGQWVLLGQYTFSEGSAGSVKVQRHGGSTGSSTLADAVRFEATSTTTVFNQSDYLLGKLYDVVSSGSTPLRLGLEDLGQYFDADDGYSGNISTTAPWADEAFGGGCQRAFAIVMTDGYYNGGDPNVGNADSDGVDDRPGDPATKTHYDGGVFTGGGSDNLADVAMKYYENDLNDGLADVVKSHNFDIATHQHMTTFSVAFGVTGNLNPDDWPNCLPEGTPGPQFIADCPTWPADPENGSDADKIDDLYHAAINGRGQFLSAGNPAELVAALQAIIDKVKDTTGSGASVSINAQELQEGTLLFQALYITGSWHGDLMAKNLDQVTGEVTDTKWSAAGRLATRTWSDRIILTYSGSAGRRFRHESGLMSQLTLAQKQALLDTTSTTLTPDEETQLAKLVAYLRGDNTYATLGGTFRTRGGPLGDLVHSTPLHYNGVVYVGSNDGMLHAFDDGSVTEADGGKELFAYVPSLVIPNLRFLAGASYNHKYYVDGDVHAAIVDDGGTPKTLLVGTLGRGGKGLYCLDITDASPTSEADAASAIPLWEYPDADSPAAGSFTGATPGSDPDLGYTYSKSAIVNSHAGPVVILGNGYDSANGRAVLYVINAMTGALVSKIDTGVGSTTVCNGLSSPTLIDPDLDGLVDYVYAGDLLGNMWKFDLSDASATNWKVAYNTAADYSGSPQPLVQVKNAVKITAGGYLQHRQPITTKPAIIRHCDRTKAGYLVIFGTGRYLGNNDFGDNSVQSLYGIWDWGPEWQARGATSADKYLGTFMQPVEAPAYGYLEYDGGAHSFVVGELVTGATSGAYGTVKSIEGGTVSGTLELIDVSGDFADNEILNGSIDGEAEANGILMVQPARYLSNVFTRTSLVGAKYVSLLKQYQILFVNGQRIISQNPIRWFDVAAPGGGANRHVGWHFDLPASNERMIRTILIRGDVTYIITSIPSKSPCASGGMSVIHALDACTGGRTVTAQFDVSGPDGVPDGIIDEHDLVNIAPPGSDPIWVAPSGLLRDAMWYTPAVLAMDNAGLDMMYFSTSEGNIETLGVDPEQVGMYYWREIYGN